MKVNEGDDEEEEVIRGRICSNRKKEIIQGGRSSN